MSWQVWEGDAEQRAAELPADIDLMVADPPYGKVYQSNHNGTAGEAITGDSDQAKIDRILGLVWKRIRPNRHGYVFGPERNGLGQAAPLVWDKSYMSGGDLALPWGNAHEPVWFYRHHYKSQPNAGALSARLRRGSVIHVPAPRGSAVRLHPNMKPVRLWQHLIESSTVPGDLVVDVFSGSCTAGVACLLLGRRYIGLESDPIYAERARGLLRATEQALKCVPEVW